MRPFVTTVVQYCHGSLTGHNINGYNWDDSGLQLEALCYADDNGLLTMSPSNMQTNLNVVVEFCRGTGMGLNVKKSASFDVINDFRPKCTVKGKELPLIKPS